MCVCEKSSMWGGTKAYVTNMHRVWVLILKIISLYLLINTFFLPISLKRIINIPNTDLSIELLCILELVVLHNIAKSFFSLGQVYSIKWLGEVGSNFFLHYVNQMKAEELINRNILLVTESIQRGSSIDYKILNISYIKINKMVFVNDTEKSIFKRWWYSLPNFF